MGLFGTDIYHDLKTFKDDWGARLWNMGKNLNSQRGETRELTNVSFAFVPLIEPDSYTAFREFKHEWNNERISMIHHKIMYPLHLVSERLRKAPESRRAYILEPDYHPVGLPCILMYHFFLRPVSPKGLQRLHLNVYLRSSDFVKVLPYDIAASEHFLVNLAREELAVQPGYLSFIIGSLHVYKEDLDELSESVA